MTKTFITRVKGGPGSGHYGHAGRPGKRGGGSSAKSVGLSMEMFTSNPHVKKYFGDSVIEKGSNSWSNNLSVGRNVMDPNTPEQQNRQVLIIYNLTTGSDKGRFLARVLGGSVNSLNTLGQGKAKDTMNEAIDDVMAQKRPQKELQEL